MPLRLCPGIENGVPNFPFPGKLQGLARERWRIVMEDQAVGKAGVVLHLVFSVISGHVV